MAQVGRADLEIANLVFRRHIHTAEAEFEPLSTSNQFQQEDYGERLIIVRSVLILRFSRNPLQRQPSSNLRFPYSER